MTVYQRTHDGTVVERVRPVDGGHLDRHYADLAARGVGGWRVDEPVAASALPAPAVPVGDDSPTPDQPAVEPVDDEPPRTRKGRGRAVVTVNDPAPEG